MAGRGSDSLGSSREGLWQTTKQSGLVSDPSRPGSGCMATEESRPVMALKTLWFLLWQGVLGEERPARSRFGEDSGRRSCAVGEGACSPGPRWPGRRTLWLLERQTPPID